MRNKTSEPIDALAKQYSNQTDDGFSDYYIPAVIILGLIGNIFCILASRLWSTIKQCRLTAYVLAWSISDTLFLLCLGLVWLKGVGVNWHDLAGVCTTTTFLSNTTSLLSAWFVAGMTFELVSTAKRPHRVYMMMTRRHCLLKRILAIILVGLVVNTWTLAMARSVPVPTAGPLKEPQEETDQNKTGLENEYGAFVCQIKADKESIFRAFTIYDLMLSVVGPLIATVGSLCVLAAHALMNRLWSRAGRRSNGPFMDLSLISYHERAGAQRGQNQLPQQAQSIRDRANSSGNLIDCSNPLRTMEHCAVPQNGLGHFPAQTQDADREHRMLIAAAPVPFGPKRPIRRRRNLMSPAQYHAMLHRRRFERCLELEGKVRPLLILKSVAYVSLNLPPFIYRFSIMLGDAEDDQHGRSVQLVIYFLFYTQFALNVLLFLLYGCIFRFLGTKKRK